MIRLTLNSKSHPEFHLFNKPTILIGSDASRADLILPGPEIQPIHLKIVEQEGFFVLSNEVNDPFVSVNGHPFGKKLLNSGDIILVHQITILFEIVQAASHDGTNTPASPTFQKADALQPAGLSSLSNDLFSPFVLPFEQEVEILHENDFDKTSIDHYLKDVDAYQESRNSSPKSPCPEPPLIAEKKQAASLKDDYLRELDDDHPQSPGSSLLKEPGRPLRQAWKWVFFFIISIVIISGIAGTIVFFSVSGKTEAQETKAAQGVSDLAIALTHARLNHLKPHNQNWSDVEFLKTNLQAILPESSSYASQIDSQGQFNCCPYTLRIYTSADLSHFLLIAQPIPNLLYWIIPQSVIIVDSHLMELRTLKDVRGLNRLLANPDPLEGLNGKEITNLVKQGDLISLTFLAAESGNSDFTPPKNLAWILPGAENLLYNAPRYYRLGQNIVHQAIHLSTTKGSSQEVAALKQEVDHFSSLKHLILYSDQGKKSADLTRKGVTLFAPSDQLLFGYVLFNAKGKIHQVHLLKEEAEQNELLVPHPKDNDHDIIAYQTDSEITGNNETIKNGENPLIDRNHPIYLELQASVTARENELKPLVAALFTLINQELASPRAQFQVEYQNLSHTYLMANAKHKKALKETLEALYEKYEDIPIHQFLAYVQELHLEHLIQHDDHTFASVDENCQQNMEALLTHIENSKSLAELDNVIHIATSWLNFDYIKDPQELIKYQNLLRNQLLEQLEKCLLTQKSHFLVKEDDKEVLQDILNQERLIKPEERDFFLEEFEELCHDLHQYSET